MVRTWVIGAVVLALWTAAAQATAHAIINEALSLDDVRRPVYRGNIRARESKSDVPETTAPSTTATPIGESLRAVTKQLLQPTDMVATDVRTPPRVRTKAGEAKIEKVGEGIAKVERIGEGVGEAIAVDTVTQGPGLSTWILLSSDQAKGRPATQATIQSVEKPSRKNETVKGKPSISKVSLKKANTTASIDEVTKSPIILQDSKFKNRTPVIVGKVPTTPADNQTKTSIITTTPPLKKKIVTTPTPPTKFIEIVPTTSLVVETDTVETVEETSTTETTTTTKRTRRPGTKKKKKNKNRRRRPSKPEEAAESKITQDNNLVNTKIEGLPNRPLSTRIYNYLAREVMPSVGVGIVGLVLTAGLAGLLLYPFGGGVARRNYEKGSTPQNNYYYSDYVPHREDHTNTAEDKVFSVAPSSINHNSYVSSYDSKYNNNKYRYEHDYGQTVNGYAGSNEYSTLPDSVKNPDYSISDSSKYYSMDPISSHYKLTDVDNSQYKLTDEDSSQYKLTTGDSSQYKLTAGDSSQYKLTNEDSSQYKLTNGDSSQYKLTNGDSSQYKVTNGGSSQYKLTNEDSSHYKLADLHTSQYKLTDSDKYKGSSNYPSLTEYTSYTNAASVGTRGGSYDAGEVNRTDTKEEDKSDKSQPEFSALVGSPQFTNTDFVGSVSLTGSYGTDGQQTGAIASEHGPRSLRTKRDVHDDFANEIDVTDDKILKKPPVLPTTDVPKVETTTEIKTTSEPFSTTESSDQETTTEFDVMNYFTYETIKDEPSETTSMDGPGGFMGFIKRLAQLKLKIGISLLRSTSDAVQRYFDNMAKKMESAVRHLQKRRRSLLLSSSRIKRDSFKLNKKKLKKHKKSE